MSELDREALRSEIVGRLRRIREDKHYSNTPAPTRHRDHAQEELLRELWAKFFPGERLS